MHRLRDYIGFLAEGTESKLLLHKNIKTPSLRSFIFKSVIVQALFFIPTLPFKIPAHKGNASYTK